MKKKQNYAAQQQNQIKKKIQNNKRAIVAVNFLVAPLSFYSLFICFVKASLYHFLLIEEKKRKFLPIKRFGVRLY